MGHRVVGVTVGDSAVRVAVVETRLRRFEIKEVHEIPRRELGWSEQDANQDEGVERRRLKEILADVIVPPLDATDTLAISFPGTGAFLRRMTFPFRDKASLTAALGPQMIGAVPLEPDQIHTAFERISTTGQETELMAAAVPIPDMAAFLDHVRAEGIEPAHVSIDGLCLAGLLPWLSVGEQGVALVWAEANNVEMTIAVGTRIVVVRSVVLSDPVLSVNGEVSSAFMREVLLAVAGAGEKGAVVGKVYVAGPNAEALVEPLGGGLAVPCEVLDPARSSLIGANTCLGMSSGMTKVVAIAVGAASGSGPGVLNLRTGAFQNAGASGLLREHFKFFALLLLMFALLGIGKTVARYVGLIQEREAVVEELREFSVGITGKEKDDFDAVLRDVRKVASEDIEIFPKWTAVAILDRISKTMMTVGKVKANSEDEQGGEGDGEGADAGAGDGEEDLNTASNGVSPDAWAVEFENIRIEQKMATLRGEAHTIEVLDQFIAVLKQEPCFHDIVTESTERIQFRRHQGWQRFSLRMVVDCEPAQKAKSAKAKKGD